MSQSNVLPSHAFHLFICFPSVCSSITLIHFSKRSACLTRELRSCLHYCVDVAVRCVFRSVAAIYRCSILFSASANHIQSCCSFQNRPPAVQGSPNNGQPPPCMSPALMNAPWVRVGIHNSFLSPNLLFYLSKYIK